MIKTSVFKIGDRVVIRVPKIDKGPADPSNVILVVIKQKNNLNHLGTEHGIIKGGMVQEVYNQLHPFSLILPNNPSKKKTVERNCVFFNKRSRLFNRNKFRRV